MFAGNASVDGNASAANTDGRVAANAMEISLITRTYVGRSEAVLLAAHCMGSAVLAGRRHLEVVYVLDDSPSDATFGAQLHSSFRSSFGVAAASQVRVEFEPLPPCSAVMFTGKLDQRQGGSPGKDRSQRSNFMMDAYARAPIIGMFDAEVCFVAPVLPSYYATAAMSSPQRRLRNAAFAGDHCECGHIQTRDACHDACVTDGAAGRERRGSCYFLPFSGGVDAVAIGLPTDVRARQK
jgi:hypothetical protein